MTQTARVTRSEGATAYIAYPEPEGGKSKLSRRIWGVREAEFPARIPEGLTLAAGDYVEIMIPPGKAVLSALWVLLFPLCLFPLFYYASGLVSSGRFSEPVKGLIGLGGVVFGFGLGALVSYLRRQAGRETLPEITRIISREQMCADSPKKDCARCGICG